MVTHGRHNDSVRWAVVVVVLTTGTLMASLLPVSLASSPPQPQQLLSLAHRRILARTTTTSITTGGVWGLQGHVLAMSESSFHSPQRTAVLSLPRGGGSVEEEEEYDDEEEYDTEEEEEEEEEDEEETDVQIEVRVEKYDEPMFPSPMTNLYVSMGVMMLGRKVDLFSPKVVTLARFAFIGYVVALQIFLFFVRIRVKMENNRTPVTTKNPLSSVLEGQLGGAAGADGGSAGMMKNLASSFLSSKSTVMEYDLKQAMSMQSGLIFNMLFMWMLHFRMEQVQPLLIQSANGLVNMIYSPLFQIYVMGRNLERPFPNPRSSSMEAAAEKLKGDTETAVEAVAADEVKEVAEEENVSDEVEESDEEDKVEESDEEDDEVEESDEEEESDEDESEEDESDDESDEEE